LPGRVRTLSDCEQAQSRRAGRHQASGSPSEVAVAMVASTADPRTRPGADGRTHLRSALSGDLDPEPQSRLRRADHEGVVRRRHAGDRQFRDPEPRVDPAGRDAPDCMQGRRRRRREDRTFWTNRGIDPKGIIRAAFSNARGNSTQGASTITQQYVKILYLTQERTLTSARSRKRSSRSSCTASRARRRSSSRLPQHDLLTAAARTASRPRRRRSSTSTPPRTSPCASARCSGQR
jgi:hypothetical protein